MVLYSMLQYQRVLYATLQYQSLEGFIRNIMVMKLNCLLIVWKNFYCSSHSYTQHSSVPNHSRPLYIQQTNLISTESPD